MSRARIFIGSSVEGLRVANAIHHALDYAAECTVWNQDVFKLTRPTMDSLVGALEQFDFAIFVMTLDDGVSIRGKEGTATRDNVVFELGLFIGKLGRERVFMVRPRDIQDFHLPTDLLGITAATYRSDREDDNISAAVGPACSQIQSAIAKHIQPSYPKELRSRFRTVSSKLQLVLVERIRSAEIPDGFPLPEDLSQARIFDLWQIGCLLDIFEGSREARAISEWTGPLERFNRTGSPATELEILLFGRELEDFERSVDAIATAETG
ncbi:MAG: nucleotide-binding protein [Alphaproteobacteria bacterium]|jgi:hypothetical protein